MRRLLKAVTRYPIISATVAVGIVVIVIAALGASSAARWTATVYVAAIVVIVGVRMIRDLVRGHAGLDILAVIAMIATLAVGEYVAALIIVLMLSGGEALEDLAGRRARRELSSLLERSPQLAHRIVDPDDTQIETTVDVGVEHVAVGDVLLVRPSEVVPVDGVLLSESGAFDESSLTGESLPAERSLGDEVLSGSLNGESAVRIRATRLSADSQYQQIVALVKDAEATKAPVVRLADRFAIPFTLVSLAIAGIAWTVSGEPGRFAEVLVLATPCPLLIAAPVAFLAGLSRAAKAGVIMKGGAVLERLARVRSAAFDKTGTLTRGRPALVEVRPAEGFDATEVLRLAAAAEQYSSHVLADGILRAARERGIEVPRAEQASEAATNGVMATVEGRSVMVGKPATVEGIVGGRHREALEPGQLAAAVAIDGVFAGSLVLADDPRPEAAGVIAWLHANGVERTTMLTGDASTTAESIAGLVGITTVHAELLPGRKVQLAAQLQPRPVMMVGDGVNDAPVLAAADVGIAMGARGATAAGEAADAVILADSLAKVVDAVSIGRHTVRVALTAIWIGIALSIALMLIATSGVIPAVVGALTQEVVDLATILFALRALGGPAPVLPVAATADAD